MTHWVVECARCRDGWISGGKGLLFPVVETDAGVFGLGFFGPELSSSPEVARTLAFFAHYAFVRFVKIDRLIAAPRLSERLILTLKWAAEGKTDQEIALILNVSGHTVDKYMRQLKQELNAVNRTSAIVLAIRHGLIG
jgi:LuxR family quorum sensing-dependent transcriptional regulator